MMEGVRVLAENAVMLTQYDFVWNVWTIFFYTLAAVLVAFAIWGAAYKEDSVLIFTSIFVVISIFLGTGIAENEGKSEVFDYTEYKVIVDDTVNMNEFMSKYEVLDRDGEIYIVKEFAENG